MLTQYWIASKLFSPSKSANPLPVGDNFADPVTSAVVFLLLWTRAYHSYSKTFVLLYKRALEPGKERIRNIQVLTSGIYHLIKSSNVLVANNRRKTKQKRPMGLVSHTREHTSPCNEGDIHYHSNQTTPHQQNIRQLSLYYSFPTQKWKKQLEYLKCCWHLHTEEVVLQSNAFTMSLFTLLPRKRSILTISSSNHKHFGYI